MMDVQEYALPSVDSRAFAQMMLAALSHDFVTPFRLAVNRCERILSFAKASAFYNGADLKEIEAVVNSISHDLYPKLTRLHNEAKHYEGSEPSRMVQVLADRVDHEIRQHRDGLHRVLALADDRNPHGVLDDTLDDLQAATDKIGSMIDGIRAILKEPHRTAPDQLRSRVSVAVKGTVNVLRPVAESLNTTLIGDVELSVQSWKMWSIFSNLLGNAVKYAKEGEGAQVQIRVGIPESICNVALAFRQKLDRERVNDKYYRVFVDSARAGGQWCEIQVTDHGRGIPEDRLWGVFKLFKQLNQGRRTRRRVAPDVQERMLQAFSHIGSDRPTEHMGIGLGLALTQYLVRTAHGEIAVSSTNGGPTTFGLWFPVEPGFLVDAARLRNDVWWRR
ncbi:MAG TPA: HAMP domain-containing sensor histidine kinase [Allosphingosinicella sp.]|nr:HAMP domain-containing sensor histidine kinase [Allosphingosinicella sp.]